MFYHIIKKNSKLEKELMEKDKQEIINNIIPNRNVLMNCYEKIYDLDREHRKSKDLVWNLVELIKNVSLKIYKKEKKNYIVISNLKKLTLAEKIAKKLNADIVSYLN